MEQWILGNHATDEQICGNKDVVLPTNAKNSMNGVFKQRRNLKKNWNKKTNTCHIDSDSWNIWDT